MSEKPSKTPLIDLLMDVPEDYRGEWETQWSEDGTPCGHAMAPIGRYCHEAADRIKALEDENQDLNKIVRLSDYSIYQERIKALEAEIKIWEERWLQSQIDEDRADEGYTKAAEHKMGFGDKQ